MNIIIFGPPGAGKGTQAKIIASNFSLNHLSSGELSRQLLDDEIIGAKVKKLLDKGELLPNTIIIDLVEKYIKSNTTAKGFIFDGYPRNIGQAKSLDIFNKKEKLKLDLIINLKLSEKESLKRILIRGKSSGRDDDNLATIKNRLLVYKERTAPILNYYKEQGKLKNLDGRESIEEVAKKINLLIKAELKKQLS